MSEVDQWLTELRRRGWYLHSFGPTDRPHLLAATWHWRDCADVILIRAEHDAVAYRTPDPDPFTPEWVTWVYGSSAVWTLRAALTYDPPDRAPLTLIPAPTACHVPDALRRPVTIRPL